MLQQLQQVHYQQFIRTDWDKYIKLPEVDNCSLPNKDLIRSIVECKIYVSEYLQDFNRNPTDDIKKVKTLQNTIVNLKILVSISLRVFKDNTSVLNNLQELLIVVEESDNYFSELIELHQKQLGEDKNLLSKIRDAYKKSGIYNEILEEESY